jgi:hypothetical protein
MVSGHRFCGFVSLTGIEREKKRLKGYEEEIAP